MYLDKRMELRLTETQKASLEAAAERESMNASQFLRQFITSLDVPVKND